MQELDKALTDLAAEDVRRLGDGALSRQILEIIRCLEALESQYVRRAHELARRKTAAA